MPSGVRITRKDTRRLQELARNSPERIREAGEAIATEMLNDIVLSFNTSPDGETYRRGGIEHVASQEGYPPNVDTGTLRASMRWARTGAFRWEISDGVEYGIFLELGTENMAPRPFVSPVFEEWRARRLASFLRSFGLFGRT